MKYRPRYVTVYVEVHYVWLRLAVVAAIVLGSLWLAYGPRDEMPPEYRQCVAWCERSEPGDNGQGCIDVECGPLLDSDEE